MKIPVNHVRFINCSIRHNSFKLVIVLFLINSSCGFSQNVLNSQRIYFISDIQTPRPSEKIILKPYKNREAKECLFADLLLQNPRNLFMLGDLTSRGSGEKAWAPVDSFMKSLNKIKTKVYAIPGNHEYMDISSKGMQFFNRRFNEEWLHGYVINIDSLAIIMLNSNFSKLSKSKLSEQLIWYRSEMNFLSADRTIKAIIVCTHHPPYSNSAIVGSSKEVADSIVPIFEKSQKSILFISGHSHNLEYFSDRIGKHFLVIGGGGGLTQPLIPFDKRIYVDLLKQDLKPIYFYLIIEKERNYLKLTAKGFKKDFRFFELNIGTIPLN